jgi:hypothetical protein
MVKVTCVKVAGQFALGSGQQLTKLESENVGGDVSGT